ncbi:scavenger receptor cysteine-rich domain-containing protein DMBT1-like [Littorina saxatilis]|uniref:scavenger receptor cysteine-rich domain-containing protein DMBT1-like n=1 Tax=Littorina saxatilis TaxID=31220 RepID=UPI0038B51633
MGFHCSNTPGGSVFSAVQVEEVRLAGGGMADRGRLEVKMGGQWGTVCDDKWDHQDARVVCRMLGQSGGVAYANAYFGAGSGAILLDVVGCSGDEGNLNMCTLALNDLAFSSCGHYEDAGVRCGMDPPNHAASFLQATDTSPLRSNCPNGTGRSPNVRLVGSGQTTSSGLVQVRNPQQGVNQFGYVCDDNWNINNAKVVCRELCYDPKEAQPGWHKPAGTHMPSSPQIVLDMVQCEGTERALADCLHQPWYVHDCSPSELAAVTCGITPSQGNVVPQAEVDCQADQMVVTFNKADNPSLKTAFIVTVPPTPSTCILDKKEDTLQIQVTLTYYDCALLSQSQQGFKLNLTFVSALLIPLVRSSSPTNGMSRIIEYRVDVKCNMPGEYSASRRLPNVDQPTLPASGDMSLQIEMMMYLDDTFSTPVNGQKLVLTQGGWVNLGVRLNTLDQRVKLVVTSCYAGPDLSDPTKPRQALLLNKCIQEDSVSIYPINNKFWGLRFQPFSFDNFTDVTIECDAYACKTGQATGSCDRSCNPSINKDKNLPW